MGFRRLISFVGTAAVVAATLWYYQQHRRPTTIEQAPSNTSPIWISRDDKHQTAIIFVHGVMGDIRKTFTSETGVYWPDLLKTDPLFKDVDIYSFGYHSEWFSRGLTIKELGDEMHTALASAEITQKHTRLIFVCHSMGGLVTRAYLSAYRDEVRNKIGFLYFYATPASGAAIATIGQHLFPNSQLAQMAQDGGEQFLLDLQREWIAAGYGQTVASYCAYERKPYKGSVYIVPGASAAGLCNAGLIAIEADHADIVKPSTLNDKPHVALRAAFIESLATQPLGSVQLIAANGVTVRYTSALQSFSVEFKAVVKSVRGAGDAIEDVYAMLYSPNAQARIPFGDGDYECTRDGTPVAVPFLFSASELSCTFRQQIGALTRPALQTPGDYRFALTFETDDKRGHSAQYCFNMDQDDLSDLLTGLGVRRYYRALCDNIGGQP